MEGIGRSDVTPQTFLPTFQDTIETHHLRNLIIEDCFGRKVNINLRVIHQYILLKSIKNKPTIFNRDDNI